MGYHSKISSLSKMLNHWELQQVGYFLFLVHLRPVTSPCVSEAKVLNSLAPSSVETESHQQEDKFLITAFRSHFLSEHKQRCLLFVSAEWGMAAYSTNEWTVKCFWKDPRIHREANCFWAGDIFIYLQEESETQNARLFLLRRNEWRL